MKTVTLIELKKAYDTINRPFLSWEDMRLLLTMECINDGTYFSFPVIGRSYLGPCQFNKTTWDEVRRVTGFTESFSKVGDLATSLKFADAYAHENQKRFTRFAIAAGKPKMAGAHFGGMLAYLCHQQGAYGAVQTLLHGKVIGKQSRASLNAFASLRNKLIKEGTV